MSSAPHDEPGEPELDVLVWDLVEAVAVISRGFGAHMEERHRHALVPVVERLRRHAMAGPRDRLPGQLNDAARHLGHLAPRPE